MKQALIVDGHNFLFRSFAVPFKFYSAKGTPLHVVSTFLSLLRRSIELTPAISDLVVVFDSPLPNSNSLLDTSYKSNRKFDYSQDEDSPFNHIKYIKWLLVGLKIAWIELDGCEADDVIASITRHFLHNGIDEVYIASSDSDFYQLLTSTTKIIRLLNKGIYEIYDETWFVNKFGICPSQYVELKSLMGDKADNIKGIEGIGLKRGLEVVTGKRRLALNNEENERLIINRKLIKLNSDIQINCETSFSQDILKMKNTEIFKQCDF